MTFVNNEAGAVTVDWVVLTAGLVGLGLAAMAVVSNGVEDLSQDTSAEMSNSVVFTNFRHREFSELYRAIVAESNLNGQDTAHSNQLMSNFFSTIDGADDTALVEFINQGADGVALHTSRVGVIDGLIGTGATGQEVADAMGLPEMFAGIIDQDVEGFLAKQRASSVTTIEINEAMQQEATRRELTW